MPGMVVRVLVEPGAAVAQGQSLIVVEAMKMENELKAPGAGTVTKVHVLAGAKVEKGDLLVELAG
jgi:propionyl-CoA carboxylase alpha chain